MFDYNNTMSILHSNFKANKIKLVLIKANLIRTRGFGVPFLTRNVRESWYRGTVHTRHPSTSWQLHDANAIVPLIENQRWWRYRKTADRP